MLQKTLPITLLDWIVAGAALTGIAQAQEIEINCGGSAYTAIDGSTWQGDQYFSGGGLYYASNPSRCTSSWLRSSSSYLDSC